MGWVFRCFLGHHTAMEHLLPIGNVRFDQSARISFQSILHKCLHGYHHSVIIIGEVARLHRRNHQHTATAVAIKLCPGGQGLIRRTSERQKHFTESKDMILELPKTPCWNCPEGNFTGTCIDARTTIESKNGKPTECLLLIFEIDIDSDDNVQYLAKKKYDLPLKRSSHLMNDISAWLGADFLKKNRTLDSECFKGKQADVSLVHINNEGHDKPFVYLQSIQASGALVGLDESSVSPCQTNSLRFQGIM